MLFIRVKEFIKKDRRIISIAMAMGLAFTVCAALYTKAYSETTQREIAQSFIRFHVLANSDSEHDQLLKQKVRDGILFRFKPELENSQGIEDTRKFLSSHLTEIEQYASDIITSNGYNYEVHATLTPDLFPTKSYGDITLPPGEYEALRIVIGDGGGANWWCVMFPPLCYVDVTKGSVPNRYKNEMKNLLSDEQYKLIGSQRSDGEIKMKLKFKVVEWWMERNPGVRYQTARTQSSETMKQ